ncbi:MAG: hypothetical protein V7K99_11745 [Nostoc sp.]
MSNLFLQESLAQFIIPFSSLILIFAGFVAGLFLVLLLKQAGAAFGDYICYFSDVYCWLRLRIFVKL